MLPSAAGVAAAWIFNLWGFADIFNAFYQANHAGLLVGQLGAAFFLPTLVVPLLLITQGLAFRFFFNINLNPCKKAGPLHKTPGHREECRSYFRF